MICVACGTISGYFRIYPRASCLGVFILLKYQCACAFADDEACSSLIEGEGSGSLENNLVDDISIEYALTKRRNLFARVFRHSSYEVLDGDVVETGGGFVWRKSFRKFKDLFKNKNREERRAAKALREAENARREE